MPAMICFSLNSGSNGNSIYVEAEGAGLLLDAGLSGKRTAERLARHGRSMKNVSAVIVSHDHRDHAGGAGILWRKFGVPVYMTARTYRAAGPNLGRIENLNFFVPGATLRLGPITVQTHPTPHDAAEPVVFTISAGRRRLGIFTDLGCVFAGLAELLGEVDAAFLESNYDPDMLAEGPYPAMLKRRIAGNGGHISNQESAELAAGINGRLQWVALSHLSEVNNTPELALRTHRRAAGRRRPIHLAGRYETSELLRIE